VHEQKVIRDRWVGGTIRYFGPDGAPVGTKSLDFSRDRFVPVYRLQVEAGGGYTEGVADIDATRVVMFRQRYGEKETKTVTIARPAVVTADSGFHTFLRAHFDELMSGAVVPFHFAVPGSLDAFKFRARRVDDGSFEGRDVVRFKVQPDSLLRLVVDPLEISYDPDRKRLVEYRGVSILPDPVTHKTYDVRIAYYSQPPADAPPLPKGIRIR
jgi:hypothetical protein